MQCLSAWHSTLRLVLWLGGWTSLKVTEHSCGCSSSIAGAIVTSMWKQRRRKDARCPQMQQYRTKKRLPLSVLWRVNYPLLTEQKERGTIDMSCTCVFWLSIVKITAKYPRNRRIKKGRLAKNLNPKKY